MTRAEMLTELLEVLNDPGSTAGAWTESTLLGYLAEGQDAFCEDTGYFTDVSNFTVTMVADVAVYAIPDRVIQILDVWDGARKLYKIPTGEIYSSDTATGAPSSWQTDQETGVLKVFPTPTATEDGDTLILQVWRYSEVALDDTIGQPEIPSRFHRACIEWAAYKAFMHHDIETQDPVKAADHLKAFKEYTERGRQALRRIQNQETRVGSDPAYRT